MHQWDDRGELRVWVSTKHHETVSNRWSGNHGYDRVCERVCVCVRTTCVRESLCMSQRGTPERIEGHRFVFCGLKILLLPKKEKKQGTPRGEREGFALRPTPKGRVST